MAQRPLSESTRDDTGSGGSASERQRQAAGGAPEPRSMPKQGAGDLQEQLMKAEALLRETESRLQEQRNAIISLQQKLEIRNLSLERLQAQFTTAADAVNRLLNERQQVRNSRWIRLGRMLGLGPAIGDDLP
ncbi:MAG TPA: hypothetical protein VN737_18385 [Bryobacteraceae bacterium]|nr:hypothetical protein [Bryobacteraceae bacterium]